MIQNFEKNSLLNLITDIVGGIWVSVFLIFLYTRYIIRRAEQPFNATIILLKKRVNEYRLYLPTAKILESIDFTRHAQLISSATRENRYARQLNATIILLKKRVNEYRLYLPTAKILESIDFTRYAQLISSATRENRYARQLLRK